MHQRDHEFSMPFRHVRLVAELAGYAHDLGKASNLFQQKLEDSTCGKLPDKQSDFIRHEWLSAWLLGAMLKPGNGGEALTAELLGNTWQKMLGASKDGPDDPQFMPVNDRLEQAMDAVLWAVCTHHGAMGGVLADGDAHGVLDVEKHVRTKGIAKSVYIDNLTMKKQTHTESAPEDRARWATLLNKMEHARKQLDNIGSREDATRYWEGVMLMARAALIFADHKVSSQRFSEASDRHMMEPGILYANTKPNLLFAIESKSTKERSQGTEANKSICRIFDQPLSWHLLNVGEKAAVNVRMFTGEDLPTVNPEIVRKVLESRTKNDYFKWQDVAVNAVSAIPGGKLVFNVASTGSGKTLANLKMAFAMRESSSIRLAVAFNLRSLTTQTFAAFRKHIKTIESIDGMAFDQDFSCLLGDRGGIKTDFSREDEDDVDFEDDLDAKFSDQDGCARREPKWLERTPQWLEQIVDGEQRDRKLVALIASPVLVSTMDWIVAAGEPGQQDRHAKAMIRVSSSDLILDEVDSYDIGATVAVMRVVQTAAMFGRNVIVSSATLSPTLADGLIAAYDAGRRTHDAMFGEHSWSLAIVGDQFEPKVAHGTRHHETNASDMGALYRDTMKTMSQGLALRDVTKRYRMAEVKTLDDDSQDSFCRVIAEQAEQLHESHKATPGDLNCKLTIGLVRVANVDTCMMVSEYLSRDHRFKVCAYHARDIAEFRVQKERHLDGILARGDDGWVKALVNVEPWITGETGDVRLIVVATPVEEVGRDHDFDWAIIEPSSMHSIIQTSGRVNRHRRRKIERGAENVVILTRNAMDLRNGVSDSAMPRSCFEKPGLKFMDQNNAGASTHPCHDLGKIIRPKEGSKFDSKMSNAVDAGMIFDEGGRETIFAHYDENAIHRKIGSALPIIRREPSRPQGQKRPEQGCEMHFMIDQYAKHFPLRSGGSAVPFIVDETGTYINMDANNDTCNAHTKVNWDWDWKLAKEQGINTWLLPDFRKLDLGQGRYAHFSLNSDQFVKLENNGERKSFRVSWNGVEVI